MRNFTKYKIIQKYLIKIIVNNQLKNDNINISNNIISFFILNCMEVKVIAVIYSHLFSDKVRNA